MNEFTRAQALATQGRLNESKRAGAIRAQVDEHKRRLAGGKPKATATPKLKFYVPPAPTDGERAALAAQRARTQQCLAAMSSGARQQMRAAFRSCGMAAKVIGKAV